MFVFLSLPLSLFGGEQEGPPWPVIRSLQSTDPVLQRLRQEIGENLKSVARSGNLAIPLRYVTYQVRKGENFYSIMARVSQDEDTLSSVNGMIHPSDLGEGDTLLIPNARGVFRKESVQENRLLSVPTVLSGTPMVFFPGEKREPGERRLFRGTGFVSPLPRIRVTGRFGRRIDPFTHRASFHGGVDLGAPMNTPVFAGASGKVRFTGWRNGYGKLVIIDHGYGYETYYGHLNRIDVRTGDPIRAGETLGLVGRTGRATGPHLHFEVRKNGVVRRPGPFDRSFNNHFASDE